MLGTYSIAGIHETLRQLAHSSFEYILTFTSGLLLPKICTGGDYTGIHAHQINFPPDQLPPDQLPPDQLPPDQLPTRSTPTRSTPARSTPTRSM